MATDVAFMKRGKGNVSGALSRRMSTHPKGMDAPPASGGVSVGVRVCISVRSRPPHGAPPLATRDALPFHREPIHAVDAQRSTKRQGWLPAEVIWRQGRRGTPRPPLPSAASSCTSAPRSRLHLLDVLDPGPCLRRGHPQAAQAVGEVAPCLGRRRRRGLEPLTHPRAPSS